MSTPNNTHQHAFSYNDWTLNKRNPLPIEEKGKLLARDTDTRRARTLAPPHRPGEGAACKACRGRSVTQAIVPGTRAPGNQAHTSPRWKGSENKGQMSPGPPGPQRTGRRAKACSESGRGGGGGGSEAQQRHALPAQGGEPAPAVPGHQWGVEPAAGATQRLSRSCMIRRPFNGTSPPTPRCQLPRDPGREQVPGSWPL